MKTGRPSKYRPEYCDLVIKYMSQGFSKEVVAAKLGISRDTLYEWAKEHKDFSDTIKKGEAKSYYFWEKAGIDGMMGRIKGFNATVWIFVMKNRFRWRDNPEPIEEEEKIEDDAWVEKSLVKIAQQYTKELEILDRVNAKRNLIS